jgi:hypothetical protein
MGAYMFFVKNKVYMHKRAMDTAMLVTNVFGEGELAVTWLNLGYSGSPWPVDMDDDITINPKDFDNWVDITETFGNKRNKPGLPC